MKLKGNWQDIALKAHSMWGYYLTGMFLLAPEIIFVVFGVDTNPRIWWLLAVAAWLYGMFGRVKDQGIDQ